mgnify:CR=1 FL=1
MIEATLYGEKIARLMDKELAAGKHADVSFDIQKLGDATFNTVVFEVTFDVDAMLQDVIEASDIPKSVGAVAIKAFPRTRQARREEA